MADEDDRIRLTIAGRKYEIHVDDLTLGEIEVIEDACDKRIDQIDFGRSSALRALVFVLRQREDPRFTMDDARHLKMSAIDFPQDEPEPEPEPVAASNGKATRRPTAAAKSAAPSA